MFRDPTTNVRYLKALFLEESYNDRSAVLYTLKNRDHDGYRSLYRAYMDMADPLERDFANAYFEDYDHWMMVCNCKWFQPYIEKWRKELNLKIRAEALLRIREIAKDESNKASFAANRLLLAGEYLTKEEKSKVGRPSKEAIREAANELFSTEKSMEDDLKRLMQ